MVDPHVLLSLSLNKALFFVGWGDPIQFQQGRAGISSPNSKPESEVVDCLLKMDPRVECMGNSMKLQIQYTDSTPGSLFFVDRGTFNLLGRKTLSIQMIIIYIVRNT